MWIKRSLNHECQVYYPCPAQEQPPQCVWIAIEGMTISKDTRSNLDRIGSGQVSYQQVVNELRAKYAKKG